MVDPHQPPEPDPPPGTPAGQPGESAAPQAPSEALARAKRLARDRGYRPGSAAGGRRRRQGQGSGTGDTRDRRDPGLLGDEVARLVGHRGWSDHVQVGSVVGRWAEIVGPEVSAHVEPVAFETPRLTVRADSTAWATQMSLLTSSILARIEDVVGTGVVTELIVHGPGGPSWRRGPLRVPGRGPRDTYG